MDFRFFGVLGGLPRGYPEAVTRNRQASAGESDSADQADPTDGSSYQVPRRRSGPGANKGLLLPKPVGLRSGAGSGTERSVRIRLIRCIRSLRQRVAQLRSCLEFDRWSPTRNPEDPDIRSLCSGGYLSHHDRCRWSITPRQAPVGKLDNYHMTIVFLHAHVGHGPGRVARSGDLDVVGTRPLVYQ